MRQNIRSLRLSEQAFVQREAIDILKASLGDGASRDVIERAAFEVSDRLVTLEEALIAGDLGAVTRMAARLSSIADNIGMEQFAAVARDLKACVQAQDYNAIAAVSRRLQRVGEASVFTVVDMTDAPVSV